MVVLRLPRPPATFIPSGQCSPASVITTPMTSPPPSPSFLVDFDIPTSALPALEYISDKLWSNTTPVTLVVGRGKRVVNGQSAQLSELIAMPISPLDPQTGRNLSRAVAKAAKRFCMGPDWMDALQRSKRHHNECLLHRSVLQNEVLFSQEGLTLLTIDRIYSIKHRLHVLSKDPPDVPAELFITSCVQLLRKAVRDRDCQPFTKAYFYHIYDHLQFRDDLLLEVAREYEDRYGEVGIIIPEKAKERQQGPRVETRAPSPLWRRRGPPSPSQRKALSPAPLRRTPPLSPLKMTTSLYIPRRIPSSSALRSPLSRRRGTPSPSRRRRPSSPSRRRGPSSPSRRRRTPSPSRRRRTRSSSRRGDTPSPSSPSRTPSPSVLKRASTSSVTRKAPAPFARRRAASPSWRRRNGIVRRPPRTPLSASDVTPITRREWEFLMERNTTWESGGLQLHVPIPVKAVAA